MRWTQKELEDLRLIVSPHMGTKKEQDAFRKAAAKLGKSVATCKMRFKRTDWANRGARKYDQKPWIPADLAFLYQEHKIRGVSFMEIASKLNRSPIACERKFHTTSWSEFNDKPNDAVQQTMASEPQIRLIDAKIDSEKQHRIDRFVDWLAGATKLDFERLAQMDEGRFREKITAAYEAGQSRLKLDDLPISFEDLKGLVRKRLEGFGYCYPKEVTLGPGVYVVVGDSHGKNTRNGMFDLLNTINKTLRPKKIIHLGHIFDDNDEMSYRWDDFPNLLIVGMGAELKGLKEQPREYDVVRSWARLGRLSVGNQYDISDIVKKSIGRIDPEVVPNQALLNLHRHEFHSRCVYKDTRIIASPGCLCERHTINTVKYLVFKNQMPSISVTHVNRGQKYNKQEQDTLRWEQGLAVVTVDEGGEFGVVLCRVEVTSKGYTTSIAGTVYHEHGTSRPDKKVFFNGDMHSPLYDKGVLDIQEQFCKDYRPDVHVNVGDIMDNRALNHHMGGTEGPAFYFKRDGEVTYGRVLVELAATRHILGRMRHWAGDSHLIVGNHERFASDFVTRHPQFKELLDIPLLLGTAELGIKVTFLKGTLDFGFAKFIHGDVKIWGGDGGTKIEKVAANYGENTIMGNIHYPAIRNGAYSVGMTGKLDQDYNEVDASQWLQGFGFIDVFEGKSFISLAIVMNGKCIIADKSYAARPVASEAWVPPRFVPRLVFDFEDEAVPAPCAPLAAPTGLQNPCTRKKGRPKG